MQARLLTRFEVIRTVLRNPLELWGEPSYTLPWIETKFFNQRTLIRQRSRPHPLYPRRKRQRTTRCRRSAGCILRPILRDGLLTAEGEVWKRSRKAMAPVFTPRHASGFAGQMLRKIGRLCRALC